MFTSKDMIVLINGDIIGNIFSYQYDLISDHTLKGNLEISFSVLDEQKIIPAKSFFMALYLNEFTNEYYKETFVIDNLLGIKSKTSIDDDSVIIQKQTYKVEYANTMKKVFPCEWKMTDEKFYAMQENMKKSYLYDVFQQKAEPRIFNKIYLSFVSNMAKCVFK